MPSPIPVRRNLAKAISGCGRSATSHADWRSGDDTAVNVAGLCASWGRQKLRHNRSAVYRYCKAQSAGQNKDIVK